MTDTNKTAQYVTNWQDERNSAALYRAIAEVEQNPQLKRVYQRLGEAEERHSCFWEAKLRGAGLPLPPFRLNWRTRTLILLARRFGPAFVLPNIEPLEQIDSHKYDLQPEAKAGGLPQQEQSHARLLRAITANAGGSHVGLEGSQIAKLEGSHRAIGGNALRAAVLGGISTVPKIINAVHKAFADSDSFDKKSPFAYAAYAQKELLGDRHH